MTVRWTVKQCIRSLIGLSLVTGSSFALAIDALVDGHPWWSFTFTFLVILNSTVIYNIWSALIQQLGKVINL